MYKKILVKVLIFFILFGQLQFWNLYVSAKHDILFTQNNSIEELYQLEQVLETSIQKLDIKIKNKKKKQKLKQKEKEIKQLIKDTKKALKKENKKENIKKIKNNAKNRALLKMISWVLDYKNIEENLQLELKNNYKKKEKALKALKKSLKKKNEYSVIISSELSKNEITEKYIVFDEKIKVKKLYTKWNKKYFLFSFSKSSILQEELFTNIETGEIPENTPDFQVIQPEVFTIESINLEWENISQTWWVEKYSTYNYFDSINTRNKVKVGVIDTGIQSSHLDLQTNVVTWYDFVNGDNDALDDQGHGTHVAGTIWANINNEWIIGVNPYVELIPLKICDENGMCPSYAITQAIAYADENNIDIINMSLWWRANPVWHVICDWINSYTQNWWIAVVAAGNSNIDSSQFVPGWCSEVISVWAVDRNNQKAEFSNYGNSVDVVAPWVGIYSTSLNNNYKKLSGTSMAAPHITWLVSLLLQLWINHNEIDFVLKKYTDSNKVLDVKTLFENEVTSLTSGDKSNENTDEWENTHNDKDENKDEATINPNIVFIENQEELDKLKFEYPDIEEPIFTNSTPKNQIIDFWDDNIAVNNIWETTEIIDIEETFESKKDFFTPGDKYFNADGEISAQDFEVNSLNKWNPTKSYKIDRDFDYKNIDFSQYDFSYEKDENIEVNSFDEEKKLDFQISSEVNYSSHNSKEDDVIIYENNSFINNYIDDQNDDDYIEELHINSTLECNIFVDWVCEFRLRKGRRYNKYTSTWWIVSLSNSKRTLFITWKQVWSTQVTYKDDSWNIKIDVLVTVKEKPAPITYDYEVNAGTHINISFPESISNMNLNITWSRIYDNLDKENNYLGIDTYTVWEQTFTLIDRQNDVRYIINVISKPQKNIFNINKTDRVETRQNDNYSDYEKNNDIVEYYTSWWDWYIYAKWVWYGEIHFTKDGWLRRVFEVTVKPIPEPKTLTCNLITGNRCTFEIKHWGILYDESRNWVIELDHGTRTIRIDWKSSWTATIYIKSYTWNYITHIVNVHVSPEPPIIKTCETPQWLSCETKKYSINENYAFAVSQQWIVDLQLIRYWKDGVRTEEETLHINWLQEWTVDVYVYKNGDHITTFQTTVLPPITPIVINDNIVKLKQTENYTTQVTWWGWEYMILEEDRDIAYVDVDKYTWELDVSAKNPGSYYPIVTDKYDQKESFKVVVEDVQLILDTYEVELKVWERQYVHIYESYYGVQLAKTNDNIRAYRTTFTNWDKAITIVWEQPGTTVLEVTDSEWNKRTVNVTVTGTSTTVPGGDPDPGTGSWGTLEWFDEFIGIEQVETGGVSWMQFTIHGEVDEVWIEYTLSNGVNEKQILAVQPDGQYIVAFTEDSTLSSNNFTPYYIKDWIAHYYNQPLIVDYNHIAVADFEINNLWYQQFQEILNWIWFNKWYNDAYQTSSQKIYDIKENITEVPDYISKAVKDVSVNTILQIIAEIWDENIPWLDKYTNLPISSYMLDKFLNGNWDDFYDSNHWISIKLRETPKYAELRSQLIENIYNYNLVVWDKLLIAEWSDRFTTPDLYYAIHRYNWKTYLYKYEDNSIYTIIEFSDNYDFAETTYGLNKTDALNHMWYYYQTNLKWNTYDWVSEYKELIQ